MVTLVTGATGFVGKRLAATLAERGDSVRGLVRDPRRADELRRLGVKPVLGSLEDRRSLAEAVAGADRVYHCAAVLGDWLDADVARRVNVEGTRNVLEAAARAGVGRAIHFSSLSVYGTKHHRGTAEDAPHAYGDPYTDTKIDGEAVARGFTERGELETVYLRPGFVYGPGDPQVIPSLLDAIARGSFAFVGDGSKEMNVVYVDDLVEAALLADRPEAVGRAYNITDGANTTIKDFVTFMAESLGAEPPSRHVPVPVALAGCVVLESLARARRAKTAPLINRSRLRFVYYNQRYSIERARTELGYEPKVGYREGLSRTLEWFGAAGMLPEPLVPATPELVPAGA